MYTGIVDGAAKPVRWIGTTLRDLRAVPEEVRRDIGQALFAAQEGKTDPSAKPLKGFGGASVLEIRCRISWQHMACRLYRAFARGHLCFARVPKEGHTGDRYAGEG